MKVTTYSQIDNDGDRVLFILLNSSTVIRILESKGEYRDRVYYFKEADKSLWRHFTREPVDFKRTEQKFQTKFLGEVMKGKDRLKEDKNYVTEVFSNLNRALIFEGWYNY